MKISLKKSILFTLCVPLAFGSSALLAQSFGQPNGAVGHGMHQPWKGYPATLVDKVRSATEQFGDVNAAIAQGWVQGTPCVSGPNSGAMGVHFVKPERIGDGSLNAAEPEALIYEPLAGGGVRLVGVEFITLADAWASQNPGIPPTLEGQLLNYVGAPNRYGLPAFFELHVWVWQRNPNGTFADWNTLVSCDKQPGD